MSAYADFCDARSALLERVGRLVDSNELDLDALLEELDATKSALSQIAFIRLTEPRLQPGRPVLRLVQP